MKFTKLTWIRQDKEPSERYFNLGICESFGVCRKGTILLFPGEECSYVVQESPEQILEMLRQ